MIKDEKNLKETSQDSIKDTSSALSVYGGAGLRPNAYSKTNKLITALYMVTDIMDHAEPLRHKLRTLGAEVLSDVYSLSTSSDLNGTIKTINKISETLSFLDIATTINLVSSMNSNILKKEFLGLKKSLEDSIQNTNGLDAQASLSSFFKDEETLPQNIIENRMTPAVGYTEYTFPKVGTRIGVQKGSTLMKAISDKASSMSNKNSTQKEVGSFDVLKKERRDEIILIIKNTPNNAGATITDIKTKAKGALASVGEKTLQRELISMVKDNVLYKTGEKRWSRYFFSR